MYAVVDIESNGAPYRKEKIIEIAVYRFDGKDITNQIVSLVNPKDRIQPYVQKLTGITPNMLEKSPMFRDISSQILEITEGAILVGHDVNFDYRMLQQSFAPLGKTFKRDVLDTIRLAKELLPNEKSYSLRNLSQSLKIPLSDHHRAADDALATVELLRILLDKRGEK